ncbi:hypothetical protein BSZ39_01985 [Bowdeniella nasicola]|uniref:DNA-3-methyladenine glycosylase II n=1 Tax=Bowdeniella nasicola TaxID=208480 RepID=A0A1Q5Q5A2_9ACTO|nr:hypothetical protein BSZ39_01985 [Bowdeniella nasicola]
MRRTLQTHTPSDSRGVFQWLAYRAITGMEKAGQTRYSRTVRLPGGPAWFEVRVLPSSPTHLVLDAVLSDSHDTAELITRVRRLFDLDADSRVIDYALRSQPEIAPLISRCPGIRLSGTVDPHELLIRTIIGQQISVAQARSTLTTLVTHLGEPMTGADDDLHRMFPTMEAIAERGSEVLRGPRARIDAVIDSARALADGSLTITRDDDSHDLRARLLNRRGIGPWTADYVRMRVLGEPDVLLAGDSALRAGARRLGLPHDAKGLTAWAERCAPWRSYLSTHLWSA